MFWGIHRKLQKLFCYNRKRNCKNCKDCYENVLTKSYKIKFIDSAGLMASSL